MSTLQQALSDYLALRRNLGFKLEREEMRLGCFLAFIEREKSPRITSRIALQFATRGESRSPLTMAGDLRAVRGFARYLLGVNPATEVPPPGLLGRCRNRFKPYIYSAAEIQRLLNAARNHPSSEKFALKPASLYCLLGLLAATGLRLGEALNLRPEDIAWSESLLRIRKAKFLKSRLVPLQPSTLRQLRAYAGRRDAFFVERPLRPESRFFVTSRGTPYSYTYVNMQFRELSRSVGLRAPDQSHGPRIHDLRHRFAVTTLLRWYRSGKQVDRLLPVLSTYLGHRNVTGTYRYLSLTPELMQAAGKRLEARWQGGRS
jgi:integrase/recombinase XerD